MPYTLGDHVAVEISKTDRTSNHQMIVIHNSVTLELAKISKGTYLHQKSFTLTPHAVKQTCEEFKNLLTTAEEFDVPMNSSGFPRNTNNLCIKLNELHEEVQNNVIYLFDQVLVEVPHEDYTILKTFTIKDDNTLALVRNSEGPFIHRKTFVLEPKEINAIVQELSSIMAKQEPKEVQFLQHLLEDLQKAQEQMRDVPHSDEINRPYARHGGSSGR